METQRQMRLRWRFPVAGLPFVNSVLRFARQFVALSMLSRSHDQSCAEKIREGTCSFSSPEPLGLICNRPVSSVRPHVS